MLWQWDRKRKESLQLRLWNLNSTSNSSVVSRWPSCQISANQCEAETSANVNKHWKTRAKGNDIITNVISVNQHFSSTFLWRYSNSRDIVAQALSFSHPAARVPHRACSQAKNISSTFIHAKFHGLHLIVHVIPVILKPQSRVDINLAEQAWISDLICFVLAYVQLPLPSSAGEGAALCVTRNLCMTLYHCILSGSTPKVM